MGASLLIRRPRARPARRTTPVVPGVTFGPNPIRPGQAQIVGLKQTGMYVNGQPVVELRLQVMTATGAPCVVTRRETVPARNDGLLTKGRPLPVVVDPARPDNLVILWESALSAPAVSGG